MKYKIPLFNLNFNKEEEEAVVETLQSKWISTGPKCLELESTFAKMLNSKFAVSLTNCTSALHLSLIALDVKKGEEVICPSLTFAATVNSIKYVGATPVFCDIDSVEHLNMSASQIESKITPKTKAIILVHFAGFPCDMNSILNLANKFNLKIIEDACHGPLSEYQGKKLGTLGDIGCFSFFSNKNISTGEGGIIVTDNQGLADKIRLLRSHGMTTLSYERAKGHATSYDIVEFGYNFRMDDIRASIGVVQLKKLNADIEKRATRRSKYLNRLHDISGIIIPFSENQDKVSNYIMPIVLKNSNVKKRDRIRKRLQEEGIQTSVHYPAVHRFSIYNDCKSHLPITEYVSDNEITLPMYGTLTDDQIDYICTTLFSVLNE